MAQHVFTARCTLFSFDAASSQYKDLGEAGCAVVASPDDNHYRLGCYNASGKYLCIARITPSNETGANIALQAEYVSFRDENNAFWSVNFGNEVTARLFCAHVTVAMFGCAGQPKENVIVCDVTVGNGAKAVFAGDTVEARYEYWVVQVSGPDSKVPSLGSKLDSSLDRPYTFAAPSSHFSMTPTMKGFESMAVGMHEGGKRVIVVPASLRKGSGPNVSLCYFVELVRKKDAISDSEQQQIADKSTTSRQLVSATGAAGENSAPTKPSAPLGFNQEQFLLVDRLRDEVFTLTQQLREARQQLGSFTAAVKRQEAALRPKSLSSAQLTFSLEKLLRESDEAQQILEEKKAVAEELDVRQRELAKQYVKLRRTSEELESSRQDAVNSTGEERLDLDSQIVNSQNQLTRVQTELEDLSRQLQGTKTLIDTTEKDALSTKSDLQVALVTFRTTETKTTGAEEQAAEEQERRAQAVSQFELLQSTMQGLQEELRLKTQQCENRIQKMDSDAVYFSSLLEKERAQASEELREVRQELLNEFASRERQHQAECERIADEAYQRGLSQGTEDGRSDAVQEVDQACRAMKQTIARHRAEERALQVRLSAGVEESTWAARTTSKELEHLRRSLETVTAENAARAVQLDGLQTRRRVVEEGIFSSLYGSLSEVSTPVLPLPFVLSVLQHGKSPSAAFEEQTQWMRAGEEEEKRQVLAWVRARVYNKPSPMPPLRFPSVGVQGGVDGDAAVRNAMNARYEDVLHRMTGTADASPPHTGVPPLPQSFADPAPVPPPAGQKSFPPPFVKKF